MPSSEDSIGSGAASPDERTESRRLIALGYVSAALTGWAMNLAFAPHRMWGLAPACLFALLGLARAWPKRAPSLAYVWGLGFFIAHNWWVYASLHDVAGMPAVYALPLTALLPAYLALFPAAAMWLASLMRVSPALKLSLGVPAAWALAEYLRGRAFTGFDWGAVGYSQINESPLSGFAPVAGVYGVGFATVCVAGLLAASMLRMGLLKRLAALLAAACVVACGGWLQRASPDFTQSDGTRATVALIQGNVPQTLKFDMGLMADQIRMYQDMVAQQTGADIVILPETAIPLSPDMLPRGLLPQLSGIAKRNGSALATGIFTFDPRSQMFLNSVLNLSDARDGDDVSTYESYSKRHLVPFGEFDPLPALTGWVYNLMDIPMNSQRPGPEGQKPMHLANQSVAFNICYEDGFGDEILRNARGASALANIGNLAWFGDSAARDLQLQHSQARALELGRYVLRANNTGLTAIIDHKGKVVAQLPRDTRAALRGQIEGRAGETPFAAFGGSRPWVGGALAIVFLLLSPGLAKARRADPVLSGFGSEADKRRKRRMEEEARKREEERRRSAFPMPARGSANRKPIRLRIKIQTQTAPDPAKSKDETGGNVKDKAQDAGEAPGQTEASRPADADAAAPQGDGAGPTDQAAQAAAADAKRAAEDMSEGEGKGEGKDEDEDEDEDKDKKKGKGKADDAPGDAANAAPSKQRGAESADAPSQADAPALSGESQAPATATAAAAATADSDGEADAGANAGLGKNAGAAETRVEGAPETENSAQNERPAPKTGPDARDKPSEDEAKTGADASGSAAGLDAKPKQDHTPTAAKTGQRREGKAAQAPVAPAPSNPAKPRTGPNPERKGPSKKKNGRRKSKYGRFY